ncbi:GNAT family N-acetyltransferase [Kribbella sp. CA-294648]|uniref:GNAT family N-acetyltransferase n=1 Tax=Kribbella sp. CA-294648 TaxID=3239948 RepID=UPI003D8E4735
MLSIEGQPHQREPVLQLELAVQELGNVATHPAYRGLGLGLATATCARLCQELMETADEITLDVAACIAAAVACYWGLGFSTFAQYEQAAFVRRS